MEEKERFEYYPKQNQLYDKINDELYCLGIKQDKTRLVDFLNLINEDWWALYERNKELREKNQQLKQQLAESEKNFIIANNLRKNSNEVLLNYKTEKYGLDKTIQELRKIKLSLPEKEWYYKGFENCERQMSSHIADLTLEVKELKQQLHDLPNKIVEEIKEKVNVASGTFCNIEEVFKFKTFLDTILKKFGG